MEKSQYSAKYKLIAWILTLCLVITLIPDIGYAAESADAAQGTVQSEQTESEGTEEPETVAESMPDWSAVKK